MAADGSGGVDNICDTRDFIDGYADSDTDELANLGSKIRGQTFDVQRRPD